MRINILFVSANPVSTKKLDLADELRGFQHALQGHDIEVMLLPAAQPGDLERAMATTDFHIVHFSGHAQDDGILMRNPAGEIKLMSVDDIKKLFAARPGVTKLAFLNACDTKEIATAIQGSVGMSIGTNDKLDDLAAKQMTERFYKSLGKGLSLEDAYAKATKAVARYFPGAMVYEPYGDAQKEKIVDSKPTDGLNVKIDGLPGWDKHFHVSHIEKQIKALEEHIGLNQTILGGLLGAGASLFVYLLICFAWPVSMSGLLPLTPDEKVALIGERPLVEWLVAVGTGIPLFIASFKKQFLYSGNEQLRLLNQLLETVRASNRMSEKLQARLHAIMEQSVRGANPE